MCVNQQGRIKQYNKNQDESGWQEEKCESTRGCILKDESGQPDKFGETGILGGGNERHRGIGTAEMMKGSGKKLAKR